MRMLLRLRSAAFLALATFLPLSFTGCDYKDGVVHLDEDDFEDPAAIKRGRYADSAQLALYGADSLREYEEFLPRDAYRRTVRLGIRDSVANATWDVDGASAMRLYFDSTAGGYGEMYDVRNITDSTYQRCMRPCVRKWLAVGHPDYPNSWQRWVKLQ